MGRLSSEIERGQSCDTARTLAEAIVGSSDALSLREFTVDELPPGSNNEIRWELGFEIRNANTGEDLAILCYPADTVSQVLYFTR